MGSESNLRETVYGLKGSIIVQILTLIWLKPFKVNGLSILQGVKLRLIQAPMRLNFSLWQPTPES